jgi:hypothetical protein
VLVHVPFVLIGAAIGSSKNNGEATARQAPHKRTNNKTIRTFIFCSWFFFALKY